MADLLFKRGSSTNLPATGVDGVFYLTTDTERLYVGIGNDKAPVELNKSIRTIDSLTNLTALRKSDGVAVGDFYYVASGASSKSGNILAVCTGFGTGDSATIPTWVQVNPDTNTELTATNSNTSVSLSSKTATISNTVSDTNSHNSKGSFQIEASGNLSMSVDGNKITLSVPAGAKYDLAAATATTGANITLTNQSDSSDVDTVNLRGDDTYITVAKDDTGIKISSVNPYNSGMSNGYGTDDNKGFKINVTDNGGTNSTTITPQIKIGSASANQQTVDFVSGLATLDVYTKGETDTAISTEIAKAEKLFDAMRYMGAIAYNSLPTSNVRIGDTYKLSDVTGLTGHKIGDLAIAQGTEDASTGYITGTITWDLVDSGNEQTITFSSSATTGEAKVSDGTNAAGYKVVGGNKTNVSYTAANGVVTATVNHDAITAPTTAGSSADVTQQDHQSADFTAITALTEDGYGHVTGITTHKFTVKDTHAILDNANSSISVSAASNVATVAVTIQDTDNEKVEKSFTITGDTDSNLVVTGSNSNINIAMVWGEF